MTMTKVYYPLLGGGVWKDEARPMDHMAEQVRQTTGEWPEEQPCVIDKDGVEYDPRVHWRTKEGDLVLITTMSDEHLQNSLRLLWRAANVWSFAAVMSDDRLLGNDTTEEARAEWAGALGGAGPSTLIEMSPFAQKGVPLLAEWDRRAKDYNAWWQKVGAKKTCGACGVVGHNRLTCRAPGDRWTGSHQVPKRKKPRRTASKRKKAEPKKFRKGTKR